MPIFASCAAHAVIDTMLLLMWHQVFFRRIPQTQYLPHLKSLINYYFRQCQPVARPLFNVEFLHTPQVWVPEINCNDKDIA